MRVAAAGGHHLQALRLGDAAIRIEHAAACARHIQESFQRSLARVAAGGHEDEHLALLAMLFAAHGQQIRQQLQRHILEGQRRAVPKLQRMRPGTNLCHRRNSLAVKARAVCAGNGLLQLLAGEVRQETLQHKSGARLIAHRRQRSNLLKGKLRELSRNIQSAVGRKAAKDRHGRRNSGSAAGRIHLHKDSSS